MTDASPYLTVAEVARELRMSDDGVRKLIRKRKLKALRLSERKTMIPRAALAAYRRRISGQAEVRFQMPELGDPVELAQRFEQTTGYSPEAWLLAWKRDELEDSNENMELMVQASALRAALARRRRRRSALVAGKSA
jgi:excisionase family DNA binding protein